MRKVLAPELLWGRRGSRDERRFAPGGRARSEMFCSSTIRASEHFGRTIRSRTTRLFGPICSGPKNRVQSVALGCRISVSRA